MRYAPIANVINTGWRHFPLNTSVGRLRIANCGKAISGDAGLVVPLVRRIAKKGNRKDFLHIVKHDKVLLMLFSSAIVLGMILISLVVMTSTLLLS